MDSPLLALVRENNWADFQPLMDRFLNWEGYGLFLQALSDLKRSALYHSRVHGMGHIERTMLHGALCAMEEPLSREDTALLLQCCAYHDVGRGGDGPDDEHGLRSAGQLGALTGREGDELTLMMAAVDAHARKDSLFESTLRSYAPADWERCVRIAQLLKDADGLDRVRIWDLDVRFLRREASRAREDFAEYLFTRYQQAAGVPLIPPFSPDLLRMLGTRQAQRNHQRGRTSRLFLPKEYQ